MIVEANERQAPEFDQPKSLRSRAESELADGTPASVVALGPPSTAAVRANKLGRRFGRRWALAHVDLDLAPGKTLLLAGANGSGKTTLLRLLAGLIEPSRGTLTVFGRRLNNDRRAWRRSVTLLGHQIGLYDGLTAAETVKLWAKLLGKSSVGERELLGEVGLDAVRHEQVGTFSAGMRKRLGLARVRLEAGRLVLLDEPFAALDRDGKRFVEQHIQRLATEGSTVIMASHDIQRSADLCDEAIVLRTGQVVWRGSAKALALRWEEGSWAG